MATYEIADIERYFGLEEGFFNNLGKADGWTFVVKLNALFESTCTLLLTVALRHEALREPLARLQMGTKRDGKLAFIHALSLLSKEEVNFLKALGDLRNSFVHNVRKTNASVAEHLQSISEDERGRLLKQLDSGYSVTSGGETLTSREIAKQSPEQAIYISAIKCFVRLHQQIAAEAAAAETSKAVIRQAMENHAPLRLDPEEARKFFYELA